MINHYDNESRLTAILRCVVDGTSDAAMLLQLGPARTREEIFISRALGKKPWAAIPPRTTLEMWLAFIAEDEAEPAAGSYTVRSCAESCIITYARRVKGASAIVPIFPPHSPYEIALAKLAGIIPVSYGVQGRPWELLLNQLAKQGPRKNVTVIYGSTPRHEDGQIIPMQDLHGYGRPWPGGGGKNLLNTNRTTLVESASTAATTKRAFSEDQIWLGLSFNNYFNRNRVTAFDNTGGVITVSTNASAYGVAFPVRCNGGTTYALSASEGRNMVAVAYYDADGTYLSNTRQGVITFTTPQNCAWFVVVLCPPNTTAIFAQLQAELGSTATTYSPYENICPITPGLDMLLENGDRLVVWSGEINTDAGEIISRSAEIASYAGEQLPGPWISSLDAYTPGATPTIGAQVVYELPDPVIYRLTQAELQRAQGCTKYLGVGAWKLCPGAVTVITAQLTTGEATTHYDLAPSEAEGWTFEIRVDGQTVTGATGALSVAAGEHSVIITATPAAGAAACYIHPTLYSEEATP